ncbi:MAG TPA: pentapeptide repeat-containing protein [Pseudonocardiaceae bacterium]
MTTVLHLSDPQFGRLHLFGGNGSAPSDHDTLSARLHADLRALRESHDLRPDVAIVSGDLAEWALPSEFRQVQEFLRRLAAELGLPHERVVIVPGNHDISRSACQAYFLDCQAEESEPRQPFWPKWKNYVALFEEFYADCPGVEFTPTRPWTFYAYPELRLAVAGLNSTMAESHRDSDHYGWLGEEQLGDAEDWLRPLGERGFTRVAVVHHNVLRKAVEDDENLRDADDLARVLGPHLDLVLHGHTHDGTLGRLPNALPVLSTGSAAVAAAARPAEVPNQYQVLRIGADGIERWGRAYSVGQKRWIADPRISEDGNSWQVTVPGRFVPEPRPRYDPPAHTLPVRDGLADQVAAVCRLRHPGAEISGHDLPSAAFTYLRVVADGRVQPIGVVPRLTAEELADFVEHVHRPYRERDPFVSTVLVYGGDPASGELVAAAKAHDVRLTSFAEYQYLVDLRPYATRQSERLAADDTYPPALYVPQRYRHFGRAEDTSPREDLLAAAMRWLGEDAGRFLLVLGDFGRGKSFLLRELARRLPTELPTLTPLLVPLRALERTHDLDTLLAAHLAAHGEDVIDLAGLRYLITEGRVVLLFDGFDELAQRISYDRAAEHLGTLIDAARGRAKVVVSSRTQHFRSTEQVLTAFGERVQQLAGRRLVELEDFDRQQILTYLTNLYGGDAGRARARYTVLDGIKDLLGLSRNPRMLGFIARLDESQLAAARRSAGEITAAGLYQLLLDQWLVHEYDRAQPRGAAPTLPVADRWAAVTGLALRLWRTTDAGVDVGELTTAATALTGLAELRLDADQAAHIIGSATLLIRDDEGLFSFVHQSVLEWLVARHVATELAGPVRPEALAVRSASPLMAQFLRDLAGDEALAAWADRVVTAADATDVERANALALAPGRAARLAPATLGRSLRGQDLAGRDLSGQDLSDADLTEARLAGADLTGADLTGATLVDANLDVAVLVNATLAGADLTGASLLGADLTGADLTDADLTRAALVGARGLRPGNAVTTGTALPGAMPRVHTRVSGDASAVACSADGTLFAVARAGVIELYDASSRTCLLTLTGHRAAVRALAFAPSGYRLVSGDTGGTMRLWDAAAGSPIGKPWPDRAAPVTALSFGPDGRTVVSGHQDGTLGSWIIRGDQANGRFLARHGGRIGSVTMSPDGQFVYSAGEDGRRRWNAASGAEVDRPYAGYRPAATVATGLVDGRPGSRPVTALTRDGRMSAVAGSTPGLVHLTGHPYRSGVLLRDGEAVVVAMAFDPDGCRVAIVSADHTVIEWDLSDTRPTGWPLAAAIRATALAYSADGVLVVAGRDGLLVRGGTDGDTLRETTWWTPLQDVATLAEDRRRLVVSGPGWVPQWWDPVTGEVPDSPPDGPGRLLASGPARPRRPANLDDRPLAASADGTLVAVGHRDGLVTIDGRLPGGTRVPAVRPPSSGRFGEAVGAAFSADNSMLATGYASGRVQVRGVATGRWLAGWTLLPAPHVALAFGPSGRLLAASAGNFAIHLTSRVDDSTWSAADDRPLTGHCAPVRALAFSADESWLVSAADDGTVRLWDVVTRTLLATYVPLRDGVATLMPDGRTRVRGTIGGEFWYSIGLRRFEYEQLTPYFPHLGDPDGPLLPR